MGKRVKKKAQSALKEKRVPTSSSKAAQKEISPTSKIVYDGVVVVKEKTVCSHFAKAVDVAKVCSKLESTESTGCEDCREGMIGRKGGKGKGKHGKNKGSSKATWICLQCGHFSCGGVGLPNFQQTHAVRHASQNRHPLVIQMENNNLRWCFSCSTLIPVDTFDDNGEKKDVLLDIVKVLKKRSSETTSVDVEDIWFGSGSILNDVKSENKIVNLPNGKDIFAVRGLVNLGNTCFFNSVMQNLLAIDILREYLLTFDGFMGPLTSALKKVFVETSVESGLRNVVNPKPLFGCICAKASQFRGYQQQDSHELLRCLLDGLSTEDLCEKKSNKSSREPSLPASPTFIDAIFGGQISSTVCCVECGNSSMVYEPFLDLSLPLPTKKPPPKKSQPAFRARKTKQPPKRVAKPRLKLNKDGDSQPTVSGCAPSSSSDSSSVTKRVSESGGKEDDAIQPVTQSDVQEADSWLDYLEPINSYQNLEPVTSYQNLEPVTSCQNLEPVTPYQNLEPSTQSDTHEASSWLDYLEPVSLSDDHNLTVKSDGILVGLESESKVDVDKNLNPQSTVDGWEDDNPVQVKDNEVLLLTYKEDDVTTLADGKGITEMSSFAVGDEEDSSDFVGVGGLFDEPEASETPSLVSNNMEGSTHLGNGFIAGNSTESDPDEVDNTDSQVSVESCLAHFVKPELLSGEHAWHCEKCSKLQEKSRKLKNKKNMSKDEGSGSGSEVVQVRSRPCLDCSNSVLVFDSNGISGSDENLTSQVPVNGFTSELPKEQGEKYNQEIACSYEHSDEPKPNGKSVVCCSAYTDHVPVERLPGSEEHELGEDEEDGDLDSKSVKVMRNATKRILISKSPTILTIHLKRFGQDARGRLSKLSGHVVFKEFIDLRPYLDNRCVRDNCIYRLIGVVEHSGSMRGGHYIAYVRGGDRSKRRSEDENHRQRHNVWYHASDAYVRETTLDEVLRSEAYLLFYEKLQL